jgi:16S rRNA processing protein RimM
MLLVVGRIGRAHGVRGDLFVEPLTDEPEHRFADGANLTTDTGQTLTVQFTKWHSGKFIVHFIDVDDRTSAENLHHENVSVEVDPMQLPEDPDEFYDHQLAGLKVQDVSGNVIGAITEVIHLPAQDLLAVALADNREVLIPFVSHIVPEVNVAQGFVVISPPPGLIDDSEAIEVRGDE